jgi:hypothetical protein
LPSQNQAISPFLLKLLSQTIASSQEHASASPKHLQQPPTKKYPSDKIRYNEKVGGRSTNITLNTKVAEKVFKAQEPLKTSIGKPISLPATVCWLVGQCTAQMAAMDKSNAAA